MANTVAELQQRADSIHGQYSFRFAGHPRITRSLSVLDQVTADLKAVGTELAALPGNGSADAKDALTAQITERVALYGTERAEIVKAQSAGPAAKEASLLGSRANAIIARYRRHFAGKDRKGRDAVLLREMIQDLQKVKEEMRLLFNVHPIDQLQRDLDVVTQNLETYIRERAEILSARDRLAINEQMSTFAQLANDQFKLYENHFAGKSRLTRRPGLLRRINDNLSELQQNMLSAKAKAVSEANDKNISIVDERLSLYRRELETIEKTRTETNLEDLAGNLGTAANELMAEYSNGFAGQSRLTRDFEALSLLCDQMGEVERQMHNLAMQRNIDMNINNLSIVRDSLAMFEREQQEIVKAQAPA